MVPLLKFFPRPSYTTARGACLAMLRALGLKHEGKGGWHFAYRPEGTIARKRVIGCRGWLQFYRLCSNYYRQRTKLTPPDVA